MAEGLLALLGHDEGDPKVVAAREDASALGDLVETLARARSDRKLTQTDVAVEMGTTQSAISNFERTGGDPKISTILRYARAIGAKIKFVAVFDQSTTSCDKPDRVPARAAQAGAGAGALDGPIYLAASHIRVAAQ